MSEAPPIRPQLLANRDFRRLWCGDTISEFGTSVGAVALPLLAIRLLHADAFQIGILAMCEYLAFLLLGLPAGAWVERLRCRPILLIGDLGRAAVLSWVPIAAALHILTIDQLYVVALSVGILTVFFAVAYQSYIPTLVGEQHIGEANAKLEASRGTAEASGPAIAGFAVKLLTAPGAIAVDAVSFVLSALLLQRIRTTEAVREEPGARHLVREMRDGIRFVVGHPLMRVMAIRSAMYNLCSTIISTMLLVLLARTLRLSPAVIGLVLTLDGIGAALGACIALRVARLFGQGQTVFLASLVVGAGSLAIPLAQHGWLLWLAALGNAIASIAVVVANITQTSFRQALCPRPMLGRMNATMRVVMWGPIPLGALLGGWLGETLGVRDALWVGAAGVWLAVLPLYLSPLRKMRTLSEGVQEGDLVAA